MDLNKAPEMYPIESWIQKSLDRVTAISNSDPTLYEPTKERYRAIASNCLDIVAVISNMLGEELTVKSDQTDPILHIYETVDKLAASLSKNVDSSSSPIRNIAQSKLAKNSYRDCINKIVAQSTSSSEVHCCAKLLSEWFENRFCLYSDGVKFHYDIMNMPEWIAGMIMLYCKHSIQHSKNTLESTMKKWYRDIRNPDNRSSSYAVPYEVYQLLNGKDSGVYLDTLVMWDILLDLGLSEVSHDMPDSYRIPSKLMIDKITSLNRNDLIDNYSDYTLDSSVLDRCIELKGDGLIQ